jgi:dephospho-CoA kinase
MSKPKIIAFVGLSLTGKSTARELCEELLSEHSIAWQKVYFGGITVDEVARRNRENGWSEAEKDLTQQQKEKLIREGLRQEFGLGVMAIKCMPQIDEAWAKGAISLIDDLYSEEEREILVDKYGEEAIALVALSADWEVRVRRGKNREIRPMTEEEIVVRDDSEIKNLHKAPPIVRAHITIANNFDELSNPIEARKNLQAELLARVVEPLITG